MGNDFKPLPIEKEINKELKKDKLDLDKKTESEIFQLCASYVYNRESEQNIIIPKEALRNMIQLSDNENFEIIFSIFGRTTEKKEKIITFEDIKYLYYSFKETKNPKIKMILFSFLLFLDKQVLKFPDLHKNISKLVPKDIQTFDYLIKYSMNIMNEREENFKALKNKKKDVKEFVREEEYYNRTEFIQKVKKDDEFLNKFNFIIKIIGTSEYKHNLVKNEKVNYICDCADKSIEINTQNDLDTMKRSFDSMTSKTNNLLYFEDFEKFLENSQIHKNLINIVIDYLKKDTQKEYCCFDDIKDIFTHLNYSKSLNDKKNFLFKMMETIYTRNKLSYIEIDKYLNIDYDQNKNDINDKENNELIYDENNFMNNSIFDGVLDKLNPFLEDFGLIPYLYFKVKANDKKIKKRLIKDILKNEKIDNFEKYLESKFEEYDYFYAINVEFWNTLMNENEEAPDYINNSKIAEEINIIKEEDKMQEEINKIQFSITKEENEKKNKKGNEKKENNAKSEIKEENKENQKKDDEKKEKNDNKEDEKSQKEQVKNEIEEIRMKQGKLKEGLKYKKDFIILCGQLFQILKNNYKIDYIIKLTKIKNVINLNKKEEKKEEKIEETTEEKKEEKKEETTEEKKEETTEEKKEETTEEVDKLKEENKKKIDEIINEEYIKNENLVKEKLDKFIIDENQGLITKLAKDEKENNKYILNELDFYPIQVYQKSLGIIVRNVEKAKTVYENLQKNKSFVLLSEKEKKKIISNKKKEKEIIQNKIQKYYELKEKIDIQRAERKISQNDYEIKLKDLHDQFEEIFIKKEKDQNDYEVDITLPEFIYNFKKYKNNIILDNKSEIILYPRYITFKNIKNSIIFKNPFLKEKKFDIYLFLFSTGTLLKPQDNYAFQEDGKELEDFVSVIVDIYSDKGKSFYDLLTNKEKERKEAEERKRIEKEQNENKKNKKVEKKVPKKVEKKDKKIEEQKKRTLTEEEKKIIKEQEKIAKLEKERLEKERKEREKEQKLKEKKEREELEKLRKEQEKLLAQKEKERKQKEKEEQQRQKQLQKERERQLQREKELEKFQSPPYGINNYGNTCYFNSINQIFLNLPILQQIFLDEKINCFINRTNKFGSQGKFFDIFKSLYWIKYSQVGETVLNLKKLVGKLKEDFNNTRQQDANEYLNFVLDNLHEDLNLHSSKRYIEEKDDIFHHNSDEVMGNISWANNLKRNTSFIDSIFKFQLKSNLKCKKCNTKKFNFETNYIFDLPLSLCKMVTVDIYLYRLPFRYKLYYNKINKKFEEYINKEENKNLNIVQNLWNYYRNVLTIEEKKEQRMKLHFNFDLEREKTMLDIIKILRVIKILELEPDNIIETYNDEKITEFKVDNLTDFITYSKENNKIIFPNSSIDKYVNSEDKIILNVYEVLNSNGMKLLFEENNKNKIFNLYSYITKKNYNFALDKFREILKNTKYSLDNKSNNLEGKTPLSSSDKSNSKKETVNIISLKEKMIIFPKEEVNNETNHARRIISEFPIPIFHYWRSNKKSTFLFRDFYHIKIREFPVQYVILNNSYNISARELYDYIWNLNILFMNHPNLNSDNFWWNQKENTENEEKKEEEEKNNKENKYPKKCYPFVLRYLQIQDKNDSSNLIHCPLCQWYTFCPGCIIDPNEGLEKLSSKYGIVVDWCYSFVLEEFQSFNFKFCREIDNQIISENLPIIDKEENYQSIKDCFNLFFVEENLEDPLYCHNCQGPEDFTKSYTINRLPYVLILSLKRFKYNQNSNFKLRQMITYPLYDLEIGNDKIKKKYDLYGVVNHYGSLSGGHYTSYIKIKNKEWYICNDSSVYKIEENRVMHSNAYILFYICKDSPYENDYIKFMKSIMNNIVINEIKDKKETIIKDDLNFFKNEPVITKYGEGYVIEENLTDFKVDENYDIYKDLEKIDELRLEKIKKKFEMEDKKEKKEDKTKENKDEKKNEKEESKEKNNNNEKKEEKKEKESSKENTNEGKEKNLEENKEENKDNINDKEGKDNNDKNINKIDENENKEEKETNKDDNIIIEKNKEEEKDKDKDKNNIESCPEYCKDFVRIKFDYGEGWITKKNIKKYNSLKQEKDKKNDKKK